MKVKFYVGARMKNIMQDLGFSEGEALLYMRLLQLGTCTISECLKGLDLSRPHAYSLMRNLVERGLVAEDAGKPTRFRVLPPDKSLEYFANSRLEELEEERKQFREKIEVLKQEADVVFSSGSAAETEAGHDMLVFRGPKLIAEWANMLKSNLKSSLRVVSKKPIILKMVGAEDVEIPSDVKRKILCDTELVHDEDFGSYLDEEMARGNAEVRYTEELPIKLAIFDDYAAIITLNIGCDPDNFLLLLTQNRELVMFLTLAFDCIWDEANELSDEE